MSSFNDSARFGINAMEQLINELVSFGAERKRLVAKVFGGGNILGLPKDQQQGSKNVSFVLEFLKTDSIKVAGRSTGGRFSRKLFFHTDTCEALPQRCINLWLKNASLALYKAIKKRYAIFRTSPYG